MSLSNQCHLVVRNLPADTTDHSLKCLFEEHGEVVHTYVVRPLTEEVSSTHGFVYFKKTCDINSAFHAKNGLQLGSHTIEVSIESSRNSSFDSLTTVLVTGLPLSFSALDVETLFSKYGTVVECRLLTDTLESGMAIIDYSTVLDVEEAISSLNGVYCEKGICPLRLQHIKPDQSGVVDRTPSVLGKTNSIFSTSASEPVHGAYDQTLDPITTAFPALESNFFRDSSTSPSDVVSAIGTGEHVQTPPAHCCQQVFRITNLPRDATVKDIHDIFSVYGCVVGIYLDWDGSWACSGTAVVEMYGTVSMKDNIMLHISGSPLHENGQPIHVSIG